MKIVTYIGCVFLALFLVFMLFSTAIAVEQKGFVTEYIVLYQPDEILKERILDVDELANYVQELQAVCTAFFESTNTPGSIDIVAVVKPGNQSRVWFANARAMPSPEDIELLSGKLLKVHPPAFRRGPVAFAIRGSIAGGTPAKLDRMPIPIPTEWAESLAKNPQKMPIPDSPMDVLWPDPPEK